MKTIGHGILNTGVHDLALSEMLGRLVSPGDTVVDVGANIGYTTLLMAAAAGPDGRVIGFEPHPALVATLRQNVASAAKNWKLASIDIRDIALSDRTGHAKLELPPDFESNDGVARISLTTNGNGPSLTVPVDTIDNVLRGTPVTVMKVDIEGHELQAFRGGSKTLASHEVKHIVFEDHDVEKSQVVGLLEGYGYRILSFGWSVRGLDLGPVRARGLAKPYESPNFIATLAPDNVTERCRARGWSVLSRRFTIDRCGG